MTANRNPVDHDVLFHQLHGSLNSTNVPFLVQSCTKLMIVFDHQSITLRPVLHSEKELQEKLRRLTEFFVPSVVPGDLYFGAHKSARAQPRIRLGLMNSHPTLSY